MRTSVPMAARSRNIQIGGILLHFNMITLWHIGRAVALHAVVPGSKPAHATCTLFSSLLLSTGRKNTYSSA